MEQFSDSKSITSVNQVDSDGEVLKILNLPPLTNQYISHFCNPTCWQLKFHVVNSVKDLTHSLLPPLPEINQCEKIMGKSFQFVLYNLNV